MYSISKYNLNIVTYTANSVFEDSEVYFRKMECDTIHTVAR